MNEQESTRTYDDVPADRERAIRRRQSVRLAVLAGIAAVLIVWALANFEDTEIDWLVATSTAPLVVVILLAAVLGAALGAVVFGNRSD